MKQAKTFVTPFLLAALAGLGGCTDSADKGVFTNGGNTESKPTPSLLKGVDLGASEADATAVTQAAMVDYELKVTSNSGAVLCDGEAKVQIMSNFSLQLPTAVINCVSLTVNLGGLLGSGAGLAAAPSTSSGNLTDDGYLLYIKDIAGADFNPPRPILVGPIVQDPSKYQGYNKTISTTLTTTGTSSPQQSATGSFTVQVLDTQTTYNNNYIQAQGGFSNVLHWKMTADGFNGVPANDGLTFQSMEFYWNTRPIMIPKIEIVGALGDFIQSNTATGTDTASGTSGAATANAIVGNVTVDLIVKDYDAGTD